MIPETPVIPVIPIPEFPEKYSSNSSMSLDTGILESPKTGVGKAGSFPVIETGRVAPPTAPGIIGILLSEQASRRLLQSGECFTIAARASHPAEPGRIALYLVPCSPALARDASDVLLGLAIARRVKPPKATATVAPISVSEPTADAPQGNVSATTAPAAPPPRPTMTA